MAERTLEQSWERYHSGEPKWESLRQRFDWMTTRCVGPDVLDVGCGGGLLGGLLALRDDIALVAGVDNYERAIVSAREHVAGGEPWQREKLVFLRLDAQTLPFPCGGFDTVVAGEVLEHVADAEAVVAELVRVARPRGRLIVTVPKGGEVTDEHLRVFDGEALGILLAGAGMVVEACEIGHWLCRCVEINR
jgi:2-polyprenyl-3-methyl-5-hydroxy-6-metoxy-1,4-benzoquinol methylase